MNDQTTTKAVETITPPSFTYKVGGITYKVNVHFNEKSSENNG